MTCVCADAQRTLDFYRDDLGFSLVKKTVNFDDPHSYHPVVPVKFTFRDFASSGKRRSRSPRPHATAS